jgi:hypothetical protein
MGPYCKFHCQRLLILVLITVSFSLSIYSQGVHKLSFKGNLGEHKLILKDLNPALPADWSGYTHLVMEIRTSSPQRFSIWLYRHADTPVRLMFNPFGQNVWLRASVPLRYFEGKDESGHDLASATNRRTDAFWYSLWGPFGKLKSIDAIGFAMPYPVNDPTLEIRSIHLSREDPGSEFLEKLPVLDEFGQWAHSDWPGKVKSQLQLDRELADEAKAFGTYADFNYCEYGGYNNTQAKATGFFRLEQINGKWWFVDPCGHLYLSTGSNGTGVGFGGRPSETVTPASRLMARRLESWGFTSGAQGKPYTIMLRWPRTEGSFFFGLSDVYSEEYAWLVDQAANEQCSPVREDSLLLGYFIGNEPAWEGRESELVDMIIAGPGTATQTRLKEFLAGGDTPERREEFVIAAFEKYLELTCAAVKKYDPNHLTLGIRFGGRASAKVLYTGRVFDVNSINVYEYEPTAQLDRAYRISGRPALIGEFHIGVPENGLSSGLVQAKDQTERGKAFRYYVEQAAALDCFLGAHWFQWRDQSPLGRRDGENYNIGLVDANNRPYKELVEAARITHKRLYDVHSGNILPFNERPKASDAGTPTTPWYDR